MNLDEIKLISLSFNSETGAVHFALNVFVIIGLILISMIVWRLTRKYFGDFYELSSMEFEASAVPKFKLKVARNTENIEIASKVFIELATRKAALEFDEENDVIVEVYNSWYNLFLLIREHIQTFSGYGLKYNLTTLTLVRRNMNILNKVLRPHLTKYQAKFRKWYETSLLEEENKDLSPQEIQKKYSEYDELIGSLKQ